MAQILSSGLGTASATSLAFSSSYSLSAKNNGVLNFRTSFLPQKITRNRSSSAALRWRFGRRAGRTTIVRCESAVAEKEEAAETSGEKFEYQAEVGFLFSLEHFFLNLLN